MRKFSEKDEFISNQIHYWEKKATADREKDPEQYAKDLDILIKLRHEKGSVRPKKEKFDWNVIINGAQVVVEVLYIGAGLATAKLAYTNDMDMKMCNGRIWNLTKIFQNGGRPRKF